MKTDKDVEEILDLFRDCIPLFSVLADEIRQNIVMVLAEKEEGLNVNTITERMPLSRPAISHHLKVLKQAGIVDSEKKGTENLYFLTLKHPIEKIKDLVSLIENKCILR
jgi:DNA-binding transcriptional ArsR family regulator